MAKGNMLNGTVKGRIGNAVYYVKQGEQNIVKYNKEVANPRTGRQMYQRARFSNAGRFFTRGRQNYFKFAFEGKKQSQSDFNAFMAYNINRSVLMSRSALQIEGYPAIGKFIMSQGSLQPVQCRIVNDYWQAAFGVIMPEGGISTIGQLSRALISTGNYAQGDILTFVYIWTTGSAYIPSAQPMGTASTTWHLKQFILNPADSTPLSNYEMRAVSRVWDEQNLLTLTDLEDSQILASSYSGFCCVHSRNTRSGLKVSTQELALGESMQEAYEYAQTSEYIDSVIADWQSTGDITYSPDAILKGSLSYSASPVTGITLAEVPTSQWQLSGNTFFTDEEIYPFALLTPAAIMGVGVVPGMFQADNIKGDAAAYVSFVQAATNQVDVHIDSTTLPAGDYEVRIYMMNGEQRIPICKIKWTSVAAVITMTPLSMNGNQPTFTSNVELPKGTFYVGAFQRQADAGLYFVSEEAHSGFRNLENVYTWSNENNRWEAYEDGQLANFIEPLANNQYRFGANVNGFWFQPFFIEIDGERKYINQSSILWCHLIKAGTGGWVIDNENIELPAEGLSGRTLVAHLEAKHGNVLVSLDELSTNNQSTGITMDIEKDASGEYYNIFATCTANSTGYIDLLWNANTVVSIYRQEE